MENSTKFLKLITALFMAMTAGLRLAQEIRNTVRKAEAEIASEDKAAEGLAKLQEVVHNAARKAAQG